MMASEGIRGREMSSFLCDKSSSYKIGGYGESMTDGGGMKIVVERMGVYD